MTRTTGPHAAVRITINPGDVDTQDWWLPGSRSCSNLHCDLNTGKVTVVGGRLIALGALASVYALVILARSRP